MVYKYEKENKAAVMINQPKANKELKEVYRKAKAFDTFLQYKEHVEKYDNSDCNELQNVFNFVMQEYEEED